MCCNIDKIYTKQRLAQLKRSGKTFIIGWKSGYRHLGKDFIRGAWTAYKFSPGVHKLKRKMTIDDYRTYDVEGFHFYYDREQALSDCGNVVFPVKIYIKDIIGLEKPDKDYYPHAKGQGVANSITILKKDWDRALKRKSKYDN